MSLMRSFLKCLESLDAAQVLLMVSRTNRADATLRSMNCTPRLSGMVPLLTVLNELPSELTATE